MNRYLRLLLVWLRARRSSHTPSAPTPGSPLGEYRTTLRVMPNDLDLLRHVNNGSYLTLLDIGRVDMTLRSGAQQALDARGWFPVVVGESIRFRRSMTLWERFTIVTRVLGWDERVIYLDQRFERTGRDGAVEVVAEAWVVARFLARAGGTVPSPEVAELFGLDPVSPPLPEAVVTWSRALDLAHRAA